ncbi:MAG: hypothetical protein NC252_12285 [Roseburia sp.]|nr:hypothetical protein [Roseburia sp.]
MEYEEKADSLDLEKVYDSLAVTMAEYYQDSTILTEYNLLKSLASNQKQDSICFESLVDLYYCLDSDKDNNIYIYIAVCLGLVAVLSICLIIIYRKCRHARFGKKRLKEKDIAPYEEKEKQETETADTQNTCSIKQDISYTNISSKIQEQQASTDIAFLKIFNKSARVKGDLKEYYSSLVNALTKESKQNKDFMNDLMSAFPNLNERNKAICTLLYAKDVEEEDIVQILNFQSVTAYRAAKSRLKTMLTVQKGKYETIDTLLQQMSKQE